MRKMGMISLAVLASVVGCSSTANAASFSACQSITDPMQRLACYDRVAKAPAASGRTATAPPTQGPVFNATPAPTLPVKALVPVVSGPRYWVEAEGGIYGFGKNLPIVAATTPPASTGPTFVPTSPGFIGLVSISTVTPTALTTGDPASLGGGGSYRMGYWLDPARTMAIDGSVFYVQGRSRLDPLTSTVVTNTFINTTPDVFVGLFNDATTTRLSETAITDKLYGADTNLRMKLPQFAAFSNFDVLAGVRYVALDEKLSSTISSILTRTYATALGLPQPTDFANSISGADTFKIRNDFIGPQVGFNAEQHWGPYWVSSEDKLAVGAMIEHASISGVNVFNTAQTKQLILAGIPITVAAGGTPFTGLSNPPAFGVFGQGNRSTVAFAAVPNGNIKVGYDINEMLSVTLAYNYLYMSSVGRVGDQAASPTGITQSGFFAQGVTLGAKAKF